MRQNIITFVDQEPDWCDLPIINIDFKRKTLQTDIEAFAQICCCENALHLHMWAIERNIRAEVFDPMGPICQDSCLEFFFRPDPDDMRYFNIEINPNGCVFLGFGSCFDDLIRLYPLEKRIHPRIIRTKVGWDLFYSIPFSFIRQFFPNFFPMPGDVLFANFYKCGDLTEIPHYFSWTQPPAIPHGFHCPRHFGLLMFAEKKIID